MFVVQHNYTSRYLVTIDNEQFIVNVYKDEKCKFEETFIVIKPSKMLSVFMGKCCISPLNEVWADRDTSDFDGHTILQGSDENDFIFISGFQIIKLSTEYKIIEFLSHTNKNMHPNVIAVGAKYT